MTLRIIGGRFKNRLLKTSKSSQTRPTSALVRKAVFDILQPLIGEAVFLDLFAGSGAIGLEALSRGASHVTFVEMDKQAIHVLKENIKTFEIEQDAQLFALDALSALKKFTKQEKQFDIIYMDPPYRLDPMPFLEFLDQHGLLKKNGRLFFEEGASNQAVNAKDLKHLKEIDQRQFGKTLLHQFIFVD